MFDQKSSKVTPYDIHGPPPPPPKENNFINNGLILIRRFRFILVVEMLLGINRIYLLKWNSIVSSLCYLYNFCLFSSIMYLMVTDDENEKFYKIFYNTNYAEYLILVILTLFQRSKFENMFQDLANFDVMMTINKEAGRTIQIHRALIWTSASIMYSLMEYGICIMSNTVITNSSIVMYIIMSTHDIEQILFVTIMRSIMIRLKVLKSRVSKVFNVEEGINTDSGYDKTEAPSNNAQLDTMAMHKAYELLHKCAEQLNSVMSFPMLVMLLTSGLSTTMLLKKLFQITQETEGSNHVNTAVIVYMSIRCIKYTIYVIVPCYYASFTSNEVSKIRVIIHNALNTFKQDKIERRKIKAFYQLAKEHDFSYALWGVIRLSMSLPFSYASLCTTYLVITIQFSKFID